MQHTSIYTHQNYNTKEYSAFPKSPLKLTYAKNCKMLFFYPSNTLVTTTRIQSNCNIAKTARALVLDGWMMMTLLIPPPGQCWIRTWVWRLDTEVRCVREDAATNAKYWITFLVFSVFPAPDSPLKSRADSIDQLLFLDNTICSHLS